PKSVNDKYSVAALISRTLSCDLERLLQSTLRVGREAGDVLLFSIHWALSAAITTLCATPFTRKSKPFSTRLWGYCPPGRRHSARGRRTQLKVRNETDAHLCDWHGICRPGYRGVFRRIWCTGGLCR